MRFKSFRVILYISCIIFIFQCLSTLHFGTLLTFWLVFFPIKVHWNNFVSSSILEKNPHFSYFRVFCYISCILGRFHVLFLHILNHFLCLIHFTHFMLCSSVLVKFAHFLLWSFILKLIWIMVGWLARILYLLSKLHAPRVQMQWRSHQVSRWACRKKDQP